MVLSVGAGLNMFELVQILVETLSRSLLIRCQGHYAWSGTRVAAKMAVDVGKCL